MRFFATITDMMDIRGHHHFAWHFEAHMFSQRLNCCSKFKSLGLWICLCKQIPPMPIISSVRNHSVGEGGGVEGWTSHEPNDNKMSRWVGGPVMNWKAIKSGDNWPRGVSAQIPSQYDPSLPWTLPWERWSSRGISNNHQSSDLHRAGAHCVLTLS